MGIVLDHTIVPARDKEASARFLARILGLRYEGSVSHFAPLRINDTLTLDFDTDDGFESHHYAFKVSEREFDEIWEAVVIGIRGAKGVESLKRRILLDPAAKRANSLREFFELRRFSFHLILSRQLTLQKRKVMLGHV